MKKSKYIFYIFYSSNCNVFYGNGTVWELLSMKGWCTMETVERFMGAMVGSAAGDALGYLIEFMNMKSIQKKYGPYGLRTILKLEANGKKSIVSDDTQLSLFTIDGLLWAAYSGLTQTEGLHRAYIRWYYTQTERMVSPSWAVWLKRQEHEVHWEYDMMAEKALFARRAPGKACLMALAAGNVFSREVLANTCRSSTALSRAIPIGLWHAGSPEEAFSAACDAALLTHGHADAYLTAGTLGAMIAFLAMGKEMGTAITGALRILQNYDEGTNVLKSVLEAVDEAVTDRNPVRSMKKIGLGWKADEALALSVYCILKTASVKDAVLMACNQDGDSDTCGAITGALTGALYGAQSIPKNWQSNMECMELLRHLTACMYQCRAKNPVDEAAQE